MREIPLAYGSAALNFSFDEDKFEILSPEPAAERPLTDIEIDWHSILRSTHLSSMMFFRPVNRS